MNKGFIRIIILTLAITLIFSVTVIAAAGDLSNVDFNDTLSEREYNLLYNKDFDHEFVVGEVLVMMKIGVPADADFASIFAGIDINRIEYLYAIGERECVKIILSESTRQNTVDAIMILKDNPYVYCAETNSRIYGAESEPDNKLQGDINGDDRISNADVVMLARYALDLIDLTSEQLLRADLNSDGKVSNADVVLLARAALEN